MRKKPVRPMARVRRPFIMKSHLFFVMGWRYVSWLCFVGHTCK